MRSTFKKFVLILLGLQLTFFVANCTSKKKKAPKAIKKEQSKKQEAKKEVHKAPHKPHWAYEGLFGPMGWGDLDPKFTACKEGQQQSPIDLVWKKPMASGGDIEFHFSPTEYKIANNGHTIKVSFPKGQWSKIRGEVYELLQLHFHSDSEHTISGKHSPIEAHLVHKNKAGGLAVIGFMFAAGKENPHIAQLWKHAPTKKGMEAGVKELFDINGLIPTKKHYYQYSGSLTTPPCSEGVNWNVFNTPIELSNAQILEFKKLYSGNFRPVRPLHKRTVTNY